MLRKLAGRLYDALTGRPRRMWVELRRGGPEGGGGGPEGGDRPEPDLQKNGPQEGGLQESGGEEDEGRARSEESEETSALAPLDGGGGLAPRPRRDHPLSDLPPLPSEERSLKEWRRETLQYPRLRPRSLEKRSGTPPEEGGRLSPVATVAVLVLIMGAALLGRQVAIGTFPEEPVQVFYAPVATAGSVWYVRRSVRYINLPGGVGLGGDMVVRGDTLSLCTRPLPPQARGAKGLQRPMTLPAESVGEHCPLRWVLPSGAHDPVTVRARLRMADDTLYYALLLRDLKGDSLLRRLKAPVGPIMLAGGLYLAAPHRRRCTWQAGFETTCLLTNADHPLRREPRRASRAQASKHARDAPRRGREDVLRVQGEPPSRGERQGRGAPRDTSRVRLAAGLTEPPGTTLGPNRLVLEPKRTGPPPGWKRPRRPVMPADSIARAEAQHLLRRLTRALEALAGTGTASNTYEVPGK